MQNDRRKVICFGVEALASARPKIVVDLGNGWLGSHPILEPDKWRVEHDGRKMRQLLGHWLSRLCVRESNGYARC